MEFNYQEQLPADFDPNSRVWIYQSSRMFTLHEAIQIEELLKFVYLFVEFSWYSGKGICKTVL